MREKDNLISNSFQCLFWNNFWLSVASSNFHSSVENPSDLLQTKVFIFWMISKCSLWEMVVLWRGSLEMESVLSLHFFLFLPVCPYEFLLQRLIFFLLFVYLIFGRLLFSPNDYALFAPFAHYLQITAMHWHLIQLIASMKTKNCHERIKLAILFLVKTLRLVNEIYICIHFKSKFLTIRIHW